MSTTHDMPLDSLSPSSPSASPSGSPSGTLPLDPVPQSTRWPLAHVLILLGLWLILFVSAVSTPPLLDDADATHAQAAQAMLATGDWVTLHVDGIRYLEKPPLPYWIAAVSLKLFAPRHAPYGRAAAFAIHFPLALTILGVALLGYAWSRRAFTTPNNDQRAALYTAIFILTSAGVFLFTRVFIPDALLSLLLAFALYALLRALNPTLNTTTNPGAPGLASETWVRRIFGDNLWPYAMWLALALAVLTKGLVSLVFLFGTALIFLLWTNQLHRWRRLRPLTGILLFLAVAAPWHILAGLRNTGGSNGHGFFWFYFINEHVLRFLGRRIPRDYNKLPGYLYWSLHLVWLFPWSLFAPAALIYAWRKRGELSSGIQKNMSSRSEPRGLIASPNNLSSRPERDGLIVNPNNLSSRPERDGLIVNPNNLSSRPERDGLIVPRSGETRSSFAPPTSFTHQTILILLIFSVIVLVFFSISTNQEYYTFPVYLPLLMLLAAALTAIERTATGPTSVPTNPGAPGPDSGTWDRTISSEDPILRRTLTFSFAAFTTIGLAIAIALAYGLWSARHLPFVPDIGELLAHRNVGDYTLSMSHFFDLTGPSFAALRFPATLALIAFLLGPPTAWLLHTRRRALPAILAIALTSTVFLAAAHIALVRFAPMLSSANFAKTIQTLERNSSISPNTEVLVFGDQAFGSSILFYLDRPKGDPVFLVDGRTTSMLFGSTFPDAPPIFLTSADLLAQWGTGPRKLLFVPLEQRDAVDQLLGQRQIILQQTSGKALITDRPLNPTPTTTLQPPNPVISTEGRRP